MKIAVLSGKGGAGKTLLAVNMAAVAGRSVYVDCDVEEPNGRLFLKPNDISRRPVYTLLPDFDPEKCSGCRKCVEFCRFNALVFIKNKPMVFSEVCHACGGCAIVCPSGAISEEKRPVGHVELGQRGDVKVITGVLNTGEASGIPVIQAALAAADIADSTTVIDCPPGSACPVMESVADADYCLLVAEPTAFGFHNFRMVYELASLLNKPCGVVINKVEDPYEALENFCGEQNIPVLLRIPYSEELAHWGAKGGLACEISSEHADMFRSLLEKIGGALK